MAEDITRVLNVEFQGGQTIKDLKNQVSSLKKELDACAVGSEEAKKKSVELQNAQANLNAAMKGAVTQNGKLDNTYAGLVAQMAKLKAEQKATCDLMTKEGQKAWKDYAKQIDAINQKLKDADADNGVFGRNVGNYANSITSALSSMGGQFGGLVGKINGVKTAMTGLKAAGGWIGALVGVLAAIIASLKQSESAMNQIKIAVAPFKGILDGILGVVEKIAGWVSDVIASALGKISDLLEKLPMDKLSKHMQEEQIIAQETISIEKDKVELIRTEADSNAKLNRLRKEMKTYAKDDAKLAKAAMEYDRERHDISIKKYEMAKREYDLIVKQNAQTESGVQDLQKEAEAYQAMLQAQEDLTTHSDEYITAMRKVSNATQEAALQQQIADKQADIAMYERVKNQAKLNMENNKENMGVWLNNKQLMEEAQGLIDADEQSITDLQGELATVQANIKEEKNKTYATAHDALVDKVKSQSAELRDYVVSYFNFGQKKIEELTNNQLQYILDHLEDAFHKDDEMINQEVLNNLDNKEVKAKVKVTPVVEVDETSEEDEMAERIKRRIQTLTTVKDAYEQSNGSFSSVQAEYDWMLNYLKAWYGTDYENNEEYLAAKAQLWEKYGKQITDANKTNSEKTVQDALATYQQLSNGVSSIMGSIADAWETTIQAQIDAGEISEEEGEAEFEQVKALQIAEATINTIAGAIGAFMGITKDTGGWGIAAAAVEAAAVLAAGFAQITQIKNTTLGGSSSSSAGGSFQLPALEAYTPDYTQNLTSQSDTENLQQSIESAINSSSIRAYVVESDITSAQSKSSKRNSEATW